MMSLEKRRKEKAGLRSALTYSIASITLLYFTLPLIPYRTVRYVTSPILRSEVEAEIFKLTSTLYIYSDEKAPPYRY